MIVFTSLLCGNYEDAQNPKKKRTRERTTTLTALRLSIDVVDALEHGVNMVQGRCWYKHCLGAQALVFIIVINVIVVIFGNYSAYRI
jgi:hypothetical protein